MNSLVSKIEELQNLSQIVAFDSLEDRKDFAEIISGFFWKFTMKSYAYFQELFKEFTQVETLFEHLLSLHHISEEIRKDEHSKRYVLLLELVRMMEETYCNKAVENPLVSLLDQSLQEDHPIREYLAGKDSTISQFIQSLDQLSLQMPKPASQEVLEPSVDEKLLRDTEELTEKLRLAEKEVQRLNEELREKHRQAEEETQRLNEELDASLNHNNKLETDEAQFHDKIKGLHKKMRWLEQSVLDEAVNVYQKNRRLKRALRAEEEQGRTLKRDLDSSQREHEKIIVKKQEQFISQEKKLQATILKLNQKVDDLNQHLKAKDNPTLTVNDEEEACAILELSMFNLSKLEIGKQYKTLAKQWHPDRFVKNPRRFRLATEIFMEINLAKDLLSARSLNSPL
ncbi:MAG: hypothetical protein COB67_06120 [SAR324 cluster bacterium]|uniref:J domain-containing protein n=1 Tax=SAR324 cluster bacterium TaxID=2024889 RepID=A0A2A4T5E6_9DELT|nr:MAG: hypothetical protein COB67_06120 [SAR324 cluster bacterium]